MLQSGDLLDDLLAFFDLGRLVAARVRQSMVGSIDAVDDLRQDRGPALYSRFVSKAALNSPECQSQQLRATKAIQTYLDLS